jgi:hypothetical protein
MPRNSTVCDVYDAPFEKNSNTKVTPIASLTPYGADMATMKLAFCAALFGGSMPQAAVRPPAEVVRLGQMTPVQRLPGSGVKYLSNLPSTPFQESASAGASPLRVMFGQLAE